MASKLERLKERERKYRTRKGGILSSLLAKKQAQQVKTPSPTSTPSGVKTSDQVVHGSNNFTFKLPVPKVKEKPSPPVSSKPKGTKQKVSTTADAGRGKVRITPSAVTTTKSAPQMVVRVPSPSQAGATPPTSKTTKTRQPSDQGIAPLIGAAAGAAAALGARYGAVKLAKKLAKPVARRTWQPRTKARPTEIIKQKTPKGPGPKLPPIAERGKGGWRPTETVGAKSAHPKPDAKPPGPTSTAKAATPRETDKFKVGKAAGSATARASVAPKAPPPTKPASQGAAGKPPKPKAPKPPADQQKQAGSTTRQAQTSPAGAGAHKSFAKSTSRQPPTEKRVERKGKPAVILRKGSAAAKRQNAPVATAAAPTSTTTEGTFTKAQLEEKIKKASGGARTTGKPQKPPVSTPKPSEVSTTKTGFPKAPRGSKLEGMPADFRLKTIVMTSGDRPYVKEGHIFVYGEGGGGPKKYSLDKYLKQFGQ